MTNLCTKVTVRKRPIKNGQLSLYLDFYPAIRNPRTGKLSRREYLGIYIYAHPKEKFEVQYNKSMLQNAELIRCQRIQSIINQDFGFIDHSKGRESFIEYFREAMNESTNYRNWENAFKHFCNYAKGECCFDDITVEFCQGFLTHMLKLKTPSGGTMKASTANNNFGKLMAVLRRAFNAGLMKENIVPHLKPAKEEQTKIEFLTFDELRRLAYEGKDYLLRIQARESEATGIPSLKIGFNNVFGYYIEVTNTHKDKVPAEWIRKQTLVNAERYITQELKDYEEKILGAQDRILVLETQIFNDLVAEMAKYIPAMQLDATLVARLDCLSSFTRVAIENRYNRPVVDDSLDIRLVEARHPVIEKQLPAGEPYISNTVDLSNEATQIMMITGPNMSGKSALLRQTALNVLLAQIGCFVAADSAKIGVVDKIFTRVGASDNISLGESTFMVEMNEAASILNNMSQRSLILFDELGRGTSTYDGISIAWAIVEHIHEYCGLHPKTLFATHYHELNDMEESYPGVRNFNVSVKEIDGKVVFLRKLKPGGSEHSFGIHVAKLAGMPPSIVRRADEVLHQLETANRGNSTIEKNLASLGDTTPGMQLSFFQLDDPVLQQIRDEIIGIDINNLTPIDALNKLNGIRKIITGK